MAEHRHKRETHARRFPRATFVAAPLAVMATLSAVTAGVLSSTPTTVVVSEGLLAPAAVAGLSSIEGRTPVLSRSSSRSSQRESQRAGGRSSAQQRSVAAELEALAEQQATDAAVARAKKERVKLWTTAPLNIWSSSGADARNLGELEEGKQVLVTGRKADGRVELVLKGESRWVSEGYLAEDKPVVTGPAAGLGGSCTNGSSVPSGVSPNIVKVHRAVCAAFPEITAYGTFRSDGDHSRGIAIDIMVSGSRGQQVADFVRANYAALGVSYVIYAQRIWSVERAGEGWRGMASRGSATANHYDHVHVTTF